MQSFLKRYVPRYWSLIHALLFYIIWFIAVKSVSAPAGENLALSLQTFFVVLCLFVTLQTSGINAAKTELYFLIAIALLGLCVDGTLSFLGLFSFPFTEFYCASFWPYPLWLLGMWFCFGTAFRTSLAWLRKRALLQIAFGAVGGTLSLFAAFRLGAVEFPHGVAFTLAIVSIEWAVVMLLAFRIEAIFETI